MRPDFRVNSPKRRACACKASCRKRAAVVAHGRLLRRGPCKPSPSPPRRGHPAVADFGHNPAFPPLPSCSHENHQLQCQRPALGGQQGFLRLVRAPRTPTCCACRRPRRRSTSWPAPSSCRRGLQGLVPRRQHQEGLQRRGDLRQARARRNPHGAGLGAEFDEEGRYLEARFGNLSVVSFYIPSGSSGELRQGYKFQVMDWLAPILRGMARQRPRLRAVRRLEHRALAHWTSGTGPPTRRTPAACPPNATGSTQIAACRWHARRTRLGRCLPRAAPGRPGLHLVEQSRRRARQQRGMAHRLPDRHARRCASALQACSIHTETALLRPCARSSWTTRLTAAAAKPARPGWRDVLRSLRQRKVLVMLLLGLSAGLPLHAGRQHHGPVAARGRHRTDRDRLPVVGRDHVFDEVPVGADHRQDRRAGAGSAAGPSARLDDPGAVGGGGRPGRAWPC